MRHRFLVLPVKKLLKSVHIYGSYRKIKTGVPFFLEHPVVWMNDESDAQSATGYANYECD